MTDTKRNMCPPPPSMPPNARDTQARYDGLADLGVIASVTYLLASRVVPEWMVPVCIVGLFAIAGVSLKQRAAGNRGDASIFMALAAGRSLAALGVFVADHAHRAGPWIVVPLMVMASGCAEARVPVADARSAVDAVGVHLEEASQALADVGRATVKLCRVPALATTAECLVALSAYDRAATGANKVVQGFGEVDDKLSVVEAVLQ